MCERQVTHARSQAGTTFSTQQRGLWGGVLHSVCHAQQVLTLLHPGWNPGCLCPWWPDRAVWLLASCHHCMDFVVVWRPPAFGNMEPGPPRFPTGKDCVVMWGVCRCASLHLYGWRMTGRVISGCAVVSGVVLCDVIPCSVCDGVERGVAEVGCVWCGMSCCSLPLA